MISVSEPNISFCRRRLKIGPRTLSADGEENIEINQNTILVGNKETKLKRVGYVFALETAKIYVINLNNHALEFLQSKNKL